jgi:hypothetical protein
MKLFKDSISFSSACYLALGTLSVPISGHRMLSFYRVGKKVKDTLKEGKKISPVH